MDEKFLPVGQPGISTYNWHANLLSVLSTDNRTKPWIYSNFIQIHCLDNTSVDTFFDYYNNPHLLPQRACPWMHIQNIKKSLLQGLGVDISDFLVESIKQGNYVYTYADLYYVPASEFYQKKHWKHEIFISGFNRSNCSFEVSDFFYGKYTTHSVSSDEITNALLSVDKSNWSIPFNGIELWSFLDDAAFSFDSHRVEQEIKHYLTGHNSTADFRGYYNPLEPYYFGIDVYKKIKHYLANLAEGRYDFLDIRPFHLLWEHKSVMMKRIQWMGENGYLHDHEKLFEEYAEIELSHMLNRNMMLKYFKTNKQADLKKVENNIDEFVEKEKRVLNDLLSKIIHIPGMIVEKHVFA